MLEITIGSRKVGSAYPPFITAEISGNHNGSLERALSLVDAAKKAGVDAIKLQTYTPDTMTLDRKDGDFFISNPKSLWKGKSLYDLYKEAYTPWEWHKPIFDRCQKLGLIFYSSPFDASAIDFLEKFNVPCYKIAANELGDHALICKAAKTGKPLILSTSTSTFAEIDEAVRAVREAGCKELLLLKGTNAYPAPPEDINLRTLPHLVESFNVPVGLSDHSSGIGVAIASIPFGSCAIEKHMTLSRTEGGVDAAFSLEPKEMGELVRESRRAWQALGKVYYGVLDSEKSSHSHKRSLYFVNKVKAGNKVKASDIRSIRPGSGLPPKFFDIIVGLKVSHDVEVGTPVQWELFH